MKEGVKIDFSVVSPVYRSRESIQELVQSIKLFFDDTDYSFEIILVDDGCPENSWGIIEIEASKTKELKGVKLSRNFGQHKAITAGIEHSMGENIIVMDCDLQDKPSEFAKLIDARKRGYEIVYTKKEERKHSLFKNLTARIYERIFNYLISDKDQEYDVGVGTMSLISRKVANSYLQVQDAHRHYLMILRWLGFSSTKVTISHEKRKYGKSSYNFSRLFLHAIDGITSQSNMLLYFSIRLAAIFFTLSILGILIIIFVYLTHGLKEGWSSIIVTILLCTSAILVSLGMNGLYIGKSFDQSKKRPLYLVDKIVKK